MSAPVPDLNVPDSIVLGQFSGLKNTVAPERLGPTDLQRATNIDIDDSGQPRRRRGQTLTLTGSWHSIKGPLAGKTYGVRDGYLGIIRPAPAFYTLGVYVGDAEVCYTEVNDDVYFSSRDASGVITQAETVTDWGHTDGQGTWFSPVYTPTDTLGEVAGTLLGDPPKATQVEAYSGRIYLADKKALWATDLYRYHYVDRTKNYMLFEHDITLVMAVDDGLYVGTTSGLYFLRGVLGSFKLQPVIDAAVLPGSGVVVPVNLVHPQARTQDVPTGLAIMCMTEAGAIAGFNNGEAYNLTQGRVEFPAAVSAAGLYRKDQGASTYVTVMDSAGAPAANARIGDYVDAEIIRAVDLVPAFLPTITAVLDAVLNKVTTGSYSGRPEGLFTSAIAPKYLFNSSGYIAPQNRLFATQTETSTLQTPEVSIIGGAPGHGFTDTGLDVDADGNFIVGCDGGAIESILASSGAGYTCGIVKVSPAGVNLGEINIRALFGLPQTATVQGVAVDPVDGSIWTACGSNGVKHVSGSWISPVALSGGFSPASGNANGLCIDSKRDYIVTLAAVPIGQVQLDFYNRADQAFIQTITMGPNGVGGGAATFNFVDHLWYDAARDYVWITAGDNGASGQVFAYNAADFTFVGSATLTQCTTIEGLIVRNGQFVATSPGYYHSASSGGNGYNQLQFYPAATGKADVDWPLEYDPVSHAVLGWRFESAFRRDTHYPNDSTQWTPINAAAAKNATSPTGVANSATTVTADAGSAVHGVSDGTTAVIYNVGDKIVSSVYLKAGTANYIWVGDRSDIPVKSATFDLQAGVVVGASNCVASMQHVGGGRYRCTRTYTRALSGAGGVEIVLGSSAHTEDHSAILANGTETFEVFDIEYGIGEFQSSSVILTDTIQQELRPADVVSVSLNALSISPNVNTFIFEGRTALGASSSTAQVAFQLDDGSESNRIRLERDTDKHLRLVVTVSDVDQCNLDMGSVDDNTDFTVTTHVAAGNFWSALNGGTAITDNAGSLPTVTVFRPGMSFTGEQWGGWIKSVSIGYSP